MMKKEKSWNIIGLIFGIVVICIGIIFINSPAESFWTESAKDCAFGADYYTEQYNATRIAASNIAITASNIRELGEKIALYSGMMLIIVGVLLILFYGKRVFVVSKEEVISENLIVICKMLEKTLRDKDSNEDT
ncbi:MAG: hypothetical protein HFH84_00615 [Lachnospiraceae bacterium]|nr:hypothetical protein [Lachnospiraceae bacterium]